MAQSLWDLECGPEDYNFENEGTWNCFFNGKPFFNWDSGQTGDAVDEPGQRSCRKTHLVQESCCFLGHLGMDQEESVHEDHLQICFFYPKHLAKFSKCWSDFHSSNHNTLFLSPFSTCELSIWRSHSASHDNLLAIGSSSRAQSKSWSNLVNVGQTRPILGFSLELANPAIFKPFWKNFGGFGRIPC